MLIGLFVVPHSKLKGDCVVHSESNARLFATSAVVKLYTSILEATLFANDHIDTVFGG